MKFRIVDSGWHRELESAFRADHRDVRLICPFIKTGTIARLLRAARPRSLRVITRFNLADFAGGVSDLGALRLILEHGGEVRGVRNLHAKVYVLGSTRAIVTSANLTDAGLMRNHEFGFIADDRSIINRCSSYFEDLWIRAGGNLTLGCLHGWEEQIARHLATGVKPDFASGLGDEGTAADLASGDSIFSPVDAPHAFVKFLGEGHNRAPRERATIDEIQRAGCHWAVAYPAKKRPTSVADGALVFIGRLTKDPSDIHIFGRAIGMRYVRGRDDATSADIALRSWKKTWSRYVRVHHAEFVDGPIANGVSLNELMKALKAKSFEATQRNAERGRGNIDPRRAYRQQAAVRLTPEGAAWLNSRLESAFSRHGKVSQAQLLELDRPEVPMTSNESRR